jgi:hypothetical protein
MIRALVALVTVTRPVPSELTTYRAESRWFVNATFSPSEEKEKFTILLVKG